MQVPAPQDTIIAVSSAWRASPLGIVRLSGAAAFDLLKRVGVALPAHGQRPCGCYDARLTVTADIVLPATVYWFRAPRSYTGQDVAEIHTVGSLPALRALCSALIALGARRALPGEFTARAFLNGRLDADQVADVLALISAQDAAAARQAARSTRVARRARVAEISARLADTLALVEAGIDFVDEEDVRLITPAQLTDSIDGLLAALTGLLRDQAVPRRAGLPHVALAGLPNAGKSTLFNALLGYERAIVSPVLGTTRDVLSAEIEIGGVACVLQDCAGVGMSADELEAAAHLAAERAADQADLVIWVHDCGVEWHALESAVCRRIAADRRIHVLSKVDACDARARLTVPVECGPWAEVSAATGAGLDRLRWVLAEKLAAVCSAGPGAGGTEELTAAAAALRRAREIAASSPDELMSPELVALELREAWERLESGRGPVVEEVLARIFSRFCVGK